MSVKRLITRYRCFFTPPTLSVLASTSTVYLFFSSCKPLSLQPTLCVSSAPLYLFSALGLCFLLSPAGLRYDTEVVDGHVAPCLEYQTAWCCSCAHFVSHAWEWQGNLTATGDVAEGNLETPSSEAACQQQLILDQSHSAVVHLNWTKSEYYRRTNKSNQFTFTALYLVNVLKSVFLLFAISPLEIHTWVWYNISILRRLKQDQPRLCVRNTHICM